MRSRWSKPFSEIYAKAPLEIQKKSRILYAVNIVVIIVLLVSGLVINTLIEQHFRTAMLDMGMCVGLLIALYLLKAGRYSIASGMTIGLLLTGLGVAGFFGYTGRPILDFMLLSFNLLPLIFYACLIGDRKSLPIVAMVVCMCLNLAFLLKMVFTGTLIEPATAQYAMFMNASLLIIVSGVLAYYIMGTNSELVSIAEGEASQVREKNEELRKAEEVLAAEKERLLVTLRSIGDAVITTDTAGNVVLMNKVAEELTGWLQNEAVGVPLTRVFNIINEKTGAACENPVEKVMKSGVVVGLANHTALVSRNGIKRSVADSGAPIRDREGNIVGVVLVFRDVTDRNRAEEALRESEELFKCFMNYGPGIAWMKDEDGRHVYLNERYERRFGVRLKDWLGKTDFEIWPPAIAEGFRANDLKVIRSGLPLEAIEQTSEPDGSVSYWLNFKFPFTDASGRRFVGGFGVDITERKQAEEELRMHRLHLEELVKERTAELSRINEQLAAEVQERRKVEETLRESETRFRVIFERSTVGKALTAPDGKLLQVNDAFAEMLGYTREEMHGINFVALTHPDDVEKSRECVRLLLSNERSSYRMEKRYIHKDGHPVWADVSTTLFRRFDGEPLYFITSITDIGERKLAEEQERLVRETLELLNRSEGSKDAIREILLAIRKYTGIEAVGIRLREGDDFPYHVAQGFPEEFVEAERYLCARDTNGSALRDEKGRPVLECLCGNVLSRQTNPVLPFFTEGGSFWSNSTRRLAATISDADRPVRGRYRCIMEGYESLALIPILAGDEIIGLLQLNDHRRDQFSPEMIRFFEGFGSAVGIALARRRAKEKLDETVAELERSNKDLEQFAYVASHDLQEPLRMVASFTQLLAERYENKLDTDAKEFISYAVDGAHRMQGLINDLLTYSRVGRRGKEFASVDCAAILERSIANLEMAIAETGAVITHDKLPTVRGDDSQLVQLFQNLIGNAIKFHGDAPPRIHISASRKNRNWVFSVRDNGIGIDPEYFERIFVIFQRLHTRNEYVGTGIGLAICKRVVERHGGRIWVESGSGKGSTFYFMIPT